MGGDRRNAPRSRLRAVTAWAVALGLGIALGACGEEASQESGEPAGNYNVKVVEAKFPAKQRLGQTSLMRIGIRNIGRRTVPGLTVTVTIAGKAGENSLLPFTVRSAEPGLAQPDRPVWVLAEHYPRLDGSSISAGAETASRKTFDFGPLKPRKTTTAVWKLSAVKAGNYTVLFKVGAGLGGQGKARAAGGVEAGGTFHVSISESPPNTIVTDSGKVVTIPSRAHGR